MCQQYKNRQHGFTLVELAIVLVIIGLILAAVLKGQEMIANSKVKNVINDLRGVSTAYYAYQDRYKAIPGDDAHASDHVTGGVNGNGDGTITGLFSATAAPVDGSTTESNKFWQHTRLSGFLTGSGTNPATNALGGVLGVQGGTTATPVFGMIGSVTCASLIPWKIAQAVDTVIDDGDASTGTVRAGVAGSAPTDPATQTTVYGTSGVTVTDTMQEGLHTICMKI